MAKKPIKRYTLRRYETTENGMEMVDIKIQIMPDGELKIDTDKIPQTIHDNADALVKHLIRDAGGQHTCEHHGTKDHLHQEHVHYHEHEHN